MEKGRRRKITGVFRAILETGLEVGNCANTPGEESGTDWGVGWVSSLLSRRIPSPSGLLPEALPAWPAPSSHREREGDRKGVLRAPSR